MQREQKALKHRRMPSINCSGKTDTMITAVRRGVLCLWPRAPMHGAHQPLGQLVHWSHITHVPVCGTRVT